MSDMWCMRGVSEEARRRAKSAAAECGMTLGKWLERAIGIAAQAGPMVAWGTEKGKKTTGTDRVEIYGATSDGRVTDKPLETITVEQVHIPKKREVKRCAHGEAKGNNCWQCGGLAKVAE